MTSQLANQWMDFQNFNAQMFVIFSVFFHVFLTFFYFQWFRRYLEKTFFWPFFNGPYPQASYIIVHKTFVNFFDRNINVLV